MMNNDSALQLSNVLNQECTRSGALPEQEACSGNHQRTGRQTVKFAAAGGVRSDPHPRKNGQYRDRQWYRHSPRKTGRGYAACCRRFCPAGNPIAFDAIDNQPVDLLFALLVPADQTKTHLHTLSRWPNGWRTKRFVVACARRRAMKSCMRSSPKQEAAMTHNGSRTLSFIVLRRNGTWY